MSNYTKCKFCIIEGSENTVKTHFSPFLRHIVVITVLIGGIYYPYRYLDFKMIFILAKLQRMMYNG